MKTKIKLLALFIVILMASCKKSNDNPVVNPPTDLKNTYGYNVLNKLKGIWKGPVISSTVIGGFPEWIVDFRPISENQISAKNELDTINDIFMSFFIAKYNNEYRVAFRNGGSFTTKKRVTYLLADSVAESLTHSYYRFSELIKGKDRAYTEVIFSADSLYISAYTNKYNTLPHSVMHMEWSAKLQDSTTCKAATTLFSYPKKTLTKDFSTTFMGLSESIFYGTAGIPEGDPYPENAQPYLGKTSASYTFASSYNPAPAKNVLLLITAQPMFNGGMFNPESLKYRSRYVILSESSKSFVFNYMHPGNYYYYAMYDNDGNGTFNSGDWISTDNTPFTLGNLGTSSVTTQINFTIP